MIKRYILSGTALVDRPARTGEAAVWIDAVEPDTDELAEIGRAHV